MFRCRSALGLTLFAMTAPLALAAPAWHALGHAVTAAEIAGWDIDVRPDGQGLPPGQGSVAEGQVIYDAQCAACHGTFGESNDYIALAGGVGSLGTATPQRTVGSKLNYATTLWDYINRAMPFNKAKTLSVNEVYAVTAYVLNLNEIVAGDAVLDQTSLPLVQMPNRAGFTTAHGLAMVVGTPDVKNNACMHDCTTGPVSVSSALPAGFTAQMYGDIANHFRHFAQAATGPATAVSTAPTGWAIAQTQGCLACHDLEQTRVGPAFTAVAAHYTHSDNAAANLFSKVRQGGSGVWGSVPMPAQTQISEAELKQVIVWILAGAQRH